MSRHMLIITGNLGRDPEMRYTNEGTPVTKLRVATNHVYNNREGERVTQTTWFAVDVWGKQAEACNEYLSKGRLVQVVGRLKPNEYGSPRIWFTSEDEPRASFDVTAQSVDFLGGRRESESEDEGWDSDNEPKPESEDEDAIPF